MLFSIPVNEDVYLNLTTFNTTVNTVDNLEQWKAYFDYVPQPEHTGEVLECIVIHEDYDQVLWS